MPAQYTRRQLFQQGAAALGALAASRVFAESAGAKPETGAPSLPVAIQRCASYEPAVVRSHLQQALDLIGGIQPLVSEKTVAIKMNLTGGPNWQLGGLPAHRTYHVHPQFVAAACALLQEAGARRIVLLESGYDQRSLETVMAAGGWDIEMINRAGGGRVTWEDTRNRGSWPSYSRLRVPWGGYVYSGFELNSWYEKADVFVSLAKLKDHANAGVTLCVKNLFGIAPTSLYGDNYDSAGKPAANEESVTARGDTFHKGTRMPPDGLLPELDPSSSRHWGHRVPRITADLFGVRPPDLCLIDGVETNRGGEGPWIQGVQPLQPQLLLAGRNGVCTDAIGSAVMGYDPTADHGQFPFMGDNHLKLLAEKQVGTHVVGQIEVRGLSLKDALYPFNPKRLKVGEPLFG
jgi:uncharacterized protein (DUF362 family)